MIARRRTWPAHIRALFARPEPTLAAPVADLVACIAELETQLDDKRSTITNLDAAIARLDQQVQSLTAEREAEHDEVKRLTEAAVRDRRIRDGALAATGRSSACLCASDAGGWRRQAEQDRVNAVRLADEVERLRLIAEEAERLHRVIELGRAGIAVVS